MFAEPHAVTASQVVQALIISRDGGGDGPNIAARVQRPGISIGGTRDRAAIEAGATWY